MRSLLPKFLVLLAMFGVGAAQALTLEEVLRNPTVQALLNRQSEINPQVLLCRDGRYNSQNLDRCNAARHALTVTQLPFEMRAIAQNPRSAQALRSLCLSASVAERNSNYLCTELARTDSAFKSTMDAQSREDAVIEDSRRQLRDTP